MATTRVFLALGASQRQPAEWIVTSSDPATPEARVEQGHAICPACDARIRLDETATGASPTGHDERLTGIEYQLHYYEEHTKPAIRYEETAS
jgi:hypothetical protein